MGNLILQLIPVACGIVLSPLAIMALIAILVSKRSRVNGIAFLIGWSIGVVAVLLLGLWIFSGLQPHELQDPPLWVDLIRIAISVLLIAAAVWVYRRGNARLEAAAKAQAPRDAVAAVQHDVREGAPPLPRWLQTVSDFRPVRAALLGVGIFVLNPVDASCAVLAALDISLAGMSPGTTTAVVVVFSIVSVAPIAIPVIYVLVRGKATQPTLDRLRVWVATHTNVLNAALLLVIGVLQLQKGVSGLL